MWPGSQRATNGRVGTFLRSHIPLTKVNSDRPRGHRVEVGAGLGSGCVLHCYRKRWGALRVKLDGSIPNGVPHMKCVGLRYELTQEPGFGHRHTAMTWSKLRLLFYARFT